MPPEIKRCVQSCCCFVDNREVTKPEYERAFQNQVEILIPCRKFPADSFPKQVEQATGFYLGTPFRRAFGTLLPAGGPFIYNHTTGERLREATTDDIKKWNEAHNRLVAETLEQRKNS